MLSAKRAILYIGLAWCAMRCDRGTDDCSPCPPWYEIQIIVKSSPDTPYPIKLKIAVEDGYPEPDKRLLNSKTQSPDPMLQPGRPLVTYFSIRPYYNPTLAEAEQEELKACIGKERRIQFELFDKDGHLLFKNTLIAKATPYEDECGTLYDTKEIDVTDKTYLSLRHSETQLITGKLDNCYPIIEFDLDKGD